MQVDLDFFDVPNGFLNTSTAPQNPYGIPARGFLPLRIPRQRSPRTHTVPDPVTVDGKVLSARHRVDVATQGQRAGEPIVAVHDDTLRMLVANKVEKQGEGFFRPVSANAI